MYVLKRLDETCSACPSQWEGTLSNGHGVYIRYRWGELLVYVSPTATKGRYNETWLRAYKDVLGDSFDGTLTFFELVKATQGVLDFSQISYLP